MGRKDEEWFAKVEKKINDYSEGNSSRGEESARGCVRSERESEREREKRHTDTQPDRFFVMIPSLV